MKLIEKRRVGRRVKKKYDEPKTPYQRVIESQLIKEKNKDKLRVQYDKLNLVELKRNIIRLQNKLFKLQAMKRTLGIEEKQRDFHIDSYVRQ